MDYILLHWSFGRESMKMTVDSMEESCNLLLKRGEGWSEYTREHETYTPLRSIMRVIENPENNIINWGNHIFSDNSYFKINKPQAVHNMSNKSLARRIFRDAGVKIPQTFFYEEQFFFPCIARPSHHHGGNHFHILNTERDLRSLMNTENIHDWYFAEVFQKTHEYRVHCAHGKALIVQDKPLVSGEIRANHAVNHESWRILKWSEFNPEICRESLKAIEVSGLDYGAVDIMYNAANNSMAICEVNTSPSINTPYCSEKYGKYFDWLIRNDYPEHFNINDRNIVFTNDILAS